MFWVSIETYEDGIAVAVIDLDGVHIDVAGAERDFLLGVEGIDPEEAGAGEGAAVFAEEDHGPGLIRFQDHETYEQYGCDDEQQDCEDAESVVDGVPEFSLVYLGEDDQCDAGG